jgi:hypothetical protein
MATKIDKVEFERRIRTVQEWVIDEWPYQDIIAQIINKWGIEERQAKRYIKEARHRLVGQEQEVVEQKRRLKIQSLRKLKRSLIDKYKGTPGGIRAIVAVEKLIIELEGLQPAQKVEVTGKGGGPIQKQVMIVNGKEIEF